MGELSEDAPDDVEGLEAAAAHVANLLSIEPADSMFPHNFFLHCFFHFLLLWVGGVASISLLI